MNSSGARTKYSVILLLTLAGMFASLTDNRVQASEYYTWPVYSPTLAYDYFDEYGEISPPTMVRNDVTNDDGTPVGTYTDRWWCFRWGSQKNSLVTSSAWIPMLQRFNDDFDYITNIMRWPRDARARAGYYSSIYLFGSGLSTDNEPNTALGGWQSSAGGMPIVLASYYPVYCFDPACSYGDKGYQTGGMIHEGVHCILASMPGCFNSCWFHEGGNNWLLGTMGAQRSGNFTGLGWLSAGSAIAPFMPIECYSGWLQDDSFGGPCAQGVNRYVDGQQLCTWRNLLGGVQYSECFPHALEVILGPKSIAWVWRYATQSGRVLQDMAQAPGGLGDAQTRRVIQEYRARQAFCDFGPWSYAFRQLLNNNWNANIHAEYEPIWINCAVWYATCYVATTQDGSVLTPEYRTLPGWSGANQIPLTVSPSATEASVTFNPIGANMSCQLVYRDTSGNIKYGVPVSSGTCSIPLANVRNNVIVAVICNTDYIYNGETTRTAKYNYTLTMGSGITGKAIITTKWYDWSPSSYTITASAGAHGSISPSGAVSVNAGGSRTFTFTPNQGYSVDQVILNGLPIGVLSSYTFNPVRGNHTISVTFKFTGTDTDPPTPNPATFAIAPTAMGKSKITMTATTGFDLYGQVQYYFTELTGHQGGSDSGWQANPEFTDSGLLPSTEYQYTVKMRDESGNETADSNVFSAVTSCAADLDDNGIVDGADLQLFTADWLYEIPYINIDVNLLGYWSFDESGGTIAFDPYGWNSAEIFGGVSLDGSGQVPLDGVDDYVSMPIGSVISSLTNCTFTGVVDFSTDSGSSARIFDFSRTTTIYMYLCPRTGTSGPMQFAITVSGSAGEQKVTAASSMPSGVHHVAVTINADADTATMYLDGVPVGSNSSVTRTPSSLGTTTKNYLGKSQFTADGYLKGAIADFRIYDFALSAEQVEILAQSLSYSPADFDMSTVVDFIDFAAFANCWLE